MARVRTAEASESLRRIRRIYRSRGSQRSRGELGYLVYTLVFATITAFFPVARAVVLAVLSPGATGALQFAVSSGSGVRTAAIAAGVVLVALASLGAARGPVAPAPFFVTLLVGGPIPRRIALRRPLIGSTSLLCIALFVAGALLGIGLGFGLGDGGWWAVAAPILTAVVLAIIGAWLWLAGQVLGARAWWIALPLAAAVVLSALLPSTILCLTPWGAAGSAAFGSLPAVIALGGLATVALLTAPRLLDRLAFEPLLSQARAWEAAGVAAGLGDFSTALGVLRVLPTAFRGVRAVRELPLAVRFFVRDLVGALRTPVRFAVSLLSLAASSALTAALLPDASGLVPALLGAGLGICCMFSASGLTDGFRHAAETAASPAIYRWSTGRLYLLHTAFPAVAGTSAALVGAAIGSALGGVLAPSVLFCAPLVVLVCVAARAYDSLKGPLPIVLTTPIPAPAGDPSILFQLIWRADALIAAGFVGGLAIHLASPAPLPAATACLFAIALFALGTARRIARAI